MITIKQAKRWYEFSIGQIVRDIDGELCIRTLSGKLYLVPFSEKDYVEKCEGYICTFWINKKAGSIKNVGICGNEPQKLTETIVDFIWNINFAHLYA